jgi:exosome complex RNA-binding protein Rrp4
MHNGNSLTKRPNIMINKSVNKLSLYNSIDKIYIPNLNDFVIGMIIQKNSDNYKLEINSLLPGVLEKEKHDINKYTDFKELIKELYRRC